MEFTATTATKKLNKQRARISGVAGGTSASKTISILLLEIDHAQSVGRPGLTSIVSESFPHLKKGAMRDFKNIMEFHGYWTDTRWNATDSIFTFPCGWKMEFFSADQPGKVRGPRRDRIFLNEANNMPYETYDQLEVRTKDKIWLDWNPTNEFWYYDQVHGKANTDFLTLTYLDNEALDQQIVDSIESRKGNKNWWKVYGLGELGEVDGKIYKDWQIIDEIPHEARLERRGLDYGYSNDPTAIVDIYYYDGGYIFDEVMYKKGMQNRQIADVLENLDDTLLRPDSAEPKSNDELIEYGINLLPAQKGPGSIKQGIDLVQSHRISVTKHSLNIIKEYRNYMWQTAKDGRIINEPEDMFNHMMDAIRYGMEGLKPGDDHTEKKPKTKLELMIEKLKDPNKPDEYIDDVLG